jgi:hypothetical protein
MSAAIGVIPLIAFRVGSPDARELEEEFSPQLNIQDLENLDKYQIYLKLLIDGLTSRPFSAKTLPPTQPIKDENNRENIIKVSRQRYGAKKSIIEDKITRWLTR